MMDADYVIVGAGSAGCVLAARLSEDPAVRVMVVEAGGEDRPMRNLRQFAANMMIHIPVGYAENLKNPAVNWLFRTEEDPTSGGRVHVWPRGKVLGGSSSINGMLYVRGQPEDYDGWAQMGATGWDWTSVLPYFRKSQHQTRETLRGDLHAEGGPLHVGDMESFELSDRVIDACVEAGLPRRADMNGADQDGVGWFQVTQHAGRRRSAAVAYLHPVMRRPNLRVVTNALVSKVLIENGRAVGVTLTRSNGIGETATACREVILAGGVVNSPQLLQLSGIGDPAHLRSMGVPITVDRAQVGQNLQDHYATIASYRLRKGARSLNERSHGLRLAFEAFRYVFTRRGLLTLAPSHICAFAKSRFGLSTPDIQLHIAPATLDPQKLMKEQKTVLERQPGLTFAPCQLRPESRGTIRIKSPDPTVHPSIVPNYLSSATDQQAIVAGLKLARDIATQPSLSSFIDHELFPGDGAASDSELLDYARGMGSTLYHPVGTCRMGNDPDAVVDPNLRVRGVDALRVVDASIMPRLVSGNTNAPVMMIAEKAAAMIRSGHL